MPARGAVESPLLPLVAQGDREALRGAIDRYGPLVWSLARRMCRDLHQAEDTVQEIFVELWRKATHFDPERGSEASFVATLTRRRLIDSGRRMSRRPELAMLEEEAESVAASDEGLRNVDLCDEAAHAARALEELRPEERQVVLLSVRDGLSHSEIAETTGLPLGTVKSHIRRGLEKVARRLKVGDREEVRP